MSQIKKSEEGYAILKALPIPDSNLVMTEKCHFCGVMHTHINPKKDERGDIPFRKSHCINKTLTRIAEDGLVVSNHIYYIDVQEEVK